MATRMICWPKYDNVCLEGGCLHCPDGERKSYSAISRSLTKAGQRAAFAVGYELRRR